MKTFTRSTLLFFAVTFIFGTASAQSGRIKFSWLGAYTNTGKPVYLHKDKESIDNAFTDDINKSLPENRSVIVSNPSFLSAGNEQELIITKPTDVYVTFVQESSGMKNALGFYAYYLNTPPGSVSEITEYTIIFPHVSDETKGGVLAAGEKVFIGNFKENVAIGFFLVQNGWNNNYLNPRSQIFYTNPAFNPEADASLRSHSVLLKDNERNRIVLGFEETRRDQGSDHDFNDVVFFISASDYSVLKTDKIPALDKIQTLAAQNNNQTGGNRANNRGGNNSNRTGNNSNNNSSVIHNTTIINNNIGDNTGNNSSQNVGNTGVAGNTANTVNSNSNANPAGNNSQTQEAITTAATPPPPVDLCAAKGFTDAEYDKTYNAIRSKTTDESIMSLMRNSVRGRTLTVPQTDKLLGLVAVQRNRLEMAKYLFDFNCEKKNYYLLSRVFNVSTFEREFDSWLSKQKVEDEVPAASAGTGSGTTTQGGANTSGCGANGMSNDDFDKLKKSIEGQSFSSTQKSVLKQGVKDKCLTVAQVRQLIKIFSFESDKLEMAKFLYDQTGDKGNYFQVNDEFGFSSSVRDLNKYIEGRK